MTSARICLYLEYTQCSDTYTQLPAAVQEMSLQSSRTADALHLVLTTM